MASDKNLSNFFKTGDFILISLILIPATLFILKSGLPSSKADKARIYLNNIKIKEVSLTKNQKVILNTEEGKVSLEIKSHGIKVLQTPCSKQICFHQGFIKKPGETIFCIPNRLMVEIISKNTPQVDAVVF